ncbi:dialkylresorcinol condensing enzyme DarA [Tamlana sp. 62-3]|uniref:Dialkylresorcinol condensing enzyme DarA n=1 Tax=Neotamlana sargassicola TaxID=2883125 RepID=A0A9X1I659_9FLAO|nr:dialkylrecorsinol condensing enzyme DarA [Tamlana sargassicola]MCB4808033.1 dialkylresorcinol condensing enzyme DarA [Tamlana sargassicola]
MKQVLVLHYSQSGQLTEIVNNIVTDFKNDDAVELHYHNIELEQNFPFPWTKKDFFGVFPDTFLQHAKAVKPIPEAILNNTYDLIIFGYQVWYLTPSLPISSFLQSESAKTLFSGSKVVTVSGTRNMWIMAHEKVKKHLKSLNASLVGNIALVDRHINHISVITIVRWMFSGKKKKYLGLFPKPGVSQRDIDNAVKFGPVIKQHLFQNSFNDLQENLLKNDAVKIKPFLITVDRKANVIFTKWANFIHKSSEPNTKKRETLLKFFNVYLFIAIWVVSPIVFILFLLTYVFNIPKIKKQKEYYTSVELLENTK